MQKVFAPLRRLFREGLSGSGAAQERTGRADGYFLLSVAAVRVFERFAARSGDRDLGSLPDRWHGGVL